VGAPFPSSPDSAVCIHEKAGSVCGVSVEISWEPMSERQRGLEALCECEELVCAG
jgi:hypothetical protein